MTDVSSRPTDRADLAVRADAAVAHIEQYERDMLGRVPVDLPVLKRILREVARVLREDVGAG